MATDMFEASGAWRKGSIAFDSVEVRKCSQRNTYKAAIRFDNAMGGWSTIKNSVVHDSLAWSVSIQKSNNVHLIDSAFVGSKAIGVQMDVVRNVTMDGTFTADVLPRTLTALDKFVDKEGCVAVCSYMTEGSKCTSIQIKNNIAAGCKFGGFIVPGYDCDHSLSYSFRDNVAHSSEGSGAYIYPDKYNSDHAKCYQGSHFTGYKNTQQCVVTHYASKEIRMHHLTCIDNQKGINL